MKGSAAIGSGLCLVCVYMCIVCLKGDRLYIGENVVLKTLAKLTY